MTIKTRFAKWGEYELLSFSSDIKIYSEHLFGSAFPFVFNLYKITEKDLDTIHNKEDRCLLWDISQIRATQQEIQEARKGYKKYIRMNLSFSKNPLLWLSETITWHSNVFFKRCIVSKKIKSHLLSHGYRWIYKQKGERILDSYVTLYNYIEITKR